MNTGEKRAHFRSFGFVVQRQAFTPDEMQAITREFDDLMTELREGQPFSGESGEHRTPFVELRPALARLAADDRIYGTVEELLGRDFVWASSEGNITVGDHLWHPDRPGDEEEISYIRLKTMIYLDETTRDAGAIRLIPGSHRVPLHEEIEGKQRHQHGPTLAPFGVPGAEVPCVAFESEPGDVLFFNQSLWHGVFHGWVGRRYIALKYAAMPQTGKQIGSLDHYSRGTIFQPLDSFAQSDDPRVRRMVDPLPALGRKQVPAFVSFR
jgi:ectoine hydroxylase-related dioxygenase (phytanoyl-CoA dioxygenase family)